MDLENLSPEAGGQLLRHLSVKGTDAELVEAATEFHGHALALNLLGSYLATVHEGEVRKRDLIPHLIDKEEQPGYHAYRVMASYEHWLVATPEKAESLFREAEIIQKEINPERPILHSTQGYRYNDLLLTQGNYQDVLIRISRTKEWQTTRYQLLTEALNLLNLGQAYLLMVKLENMDMLHQAVTALSDAIIALRASGFQENLIRGLLAQAELYRIRSEFQLAKQNIEEVYEIAKRGEMKLHLADYHLEACRLCSAEGKMETGGGRTEAVEKKKREAEEHLRVASEMIEEMGYGRRRPEVEELRK